MSLETRLDNRSYFSLLISYGLVYKIYTPSLSGASVHMHRQSVSYVAATHAYNHAERGSVNHNGRKIWSHLLCGMLVGARSGIFTHTYSSLFSLHSHLYGWKHLVEQRSVVRLFWSNRRSIVSEGWKISIFLIFTFFSCDISQVQMLLLKCPVNIYHPIY